MTDERPGKKQSPPKKAPTPTSKEATPDVSRTDLAAVVDALTATNEKKFEY
ncbi:MAG: hypothetical protein AAGC80_16940 [Rhodococcus sp. (in: high G+C Gram-positive bacteria)]